MKSNIHFCTQFYYPYKSHCSLIVLFVLCLLFSFNLSAGRGPRFDRKLCNKNFGFVKEQKQMCRNKFTLMPSILRGHNMALQECQHQFRDYRWNCSGHNITIWSRNRRRNNRHKRKKRRPKTYMDKLLSKGTPEAAFFLAMTSAGVSHSITEGCSKGEHHRTCGCDKSMATDTKNISNSFSWSGCSHNIDFGIALAGQFLDPKIHRRMKKNMVRGMVNMHNNLVGRNAVRFLMKTDCKCHGMSGSCELRTCWRSLPAFRTVGDHLRKSFPNAIMVTYTPFQLLPFNGKVVHKSNLVFLRESPNFCTRNPKVGSLGTRGRSCNASSPDNHPSNCKEMCCGRGFRTDTSKVYMNCKCKFKWCCKVECERCLIELKKSTCN